MWTSVKAIRVEMALPVIPKPAILSANAKTDGMANTARNASKTVKQMRTTATPCMPRVVIWGLVGTRVIASLAGMATAKLAKTSTSARAIHA